MPPSSIPRLSGSPAHNRLQFVNDLEEAAVSICPLIANAIDKLRELGAQEAAMTGSGSAVFGVFEDATGARTAAAALRKAGFWAEAVQTLGSGLRIERVDGR